MRDENICIFSDFLKIRVDNIDSYALERAEIVFLQRCMAVVLSGEGLGYREMTSQVVRGNFPGTMHRMLHLNDIISGMPYFIQFFQNDFDVHSKL